MSNKGNIYDFFASLFKPENQQDLKKLGIGFATIVISCAVFYIAYNDPKALTEQFYIYCFFGIIPIIIGTLIASKIFSGPIDINRFYFYIGVLVIFGLSAYMFYQTLNPKSVVNVYYLMMVLTILTFIFGLAILYRIFVRLIINTHGWFGFFLKVLFLIPCFLIETLETVFVELKSAPKMVIALFILELLIILAYIYIPKATKASPMNSVILLNKPLFLNKLSAIGNHSNQFMLMDVKSVDNPAKDEKLIRRNYSISMWFYVNQHPSSNAAYAKEKNIFRYGYPNSKIGHPRIAYFNDTTDANKSDKFIVYVNDAYPENERILLQIPTQSWNQLTITYNENTVDIFVNGNLEKSLQLTTEGLPTYDLGDIVEIGEGDGTVTNGGLHGAICNVVYHKTPLTPFQIAGDYNLNRYKNPPVNE
jgi:hypothetical protein